MITAVLLALLCGLMVGMSRALNGRLSVTLGPARTSLWNHAVGFGFLSVLVLLSGDGEMVAGMHAPVSDYLGGVLGVVFVATNSHVLARLGATRTTTLVISAQMLTSVVIDRAGSPNSGDFLFDLCAIFLIAFGVQSSRPGQQRMILRQID